MAGVHRLAAAKQLSWQEIACLAVTLGELDRQLWEIDENLVRAELTELERADHLKRRKELFDAKGGKRISTPGGEQKVGFDRDAADKTGMSKQAINRSRNRAERIALDVQARIKELPAADSGVELDALASLSHNEQRQAIDRVATGASANFRAAKASLKGGEAGVTAAQVEKELRNLKKTWVHASTRAREQFISFLIEDYAKGGTWPGITRPAPVAVVEKPHGGESTPAAHAPAAEGHSGPQDLRQT